MGSNWVLLKNDMKHNFPIPLSAAVFIVGLSYIIFGIHQVELSSKNIIIERLFPFIGIGIIPSLFYPEYQSPIKDLLQMRKTDLLKLYGFRLGLYWLFYFLVTVSYIVLLYEGHEPYSLSAAVAQSLSIGSFIGALGLFICSMTNNLVLGYLVCCTIMLAQWFTKKETLGIFFLYTLNAFSSKKVGLLFTGSAVLILVAIFLWKRRQI